MKTIVKLSSVLLLALLVFLPLQSASASSGAYEGQVIFGQSYTLNAGGTMDGDLLVFGGSATVEEGAAINGNAILFGGTLTVNGTVNGDVATIGGSVNLGAAAHVTGNLTTVAASLDRADGSTVDGQIYNTATSWVSNGDNIVPVVRPIGPTVTPPVPVIPEINFEFKPLISILNAFGQSLAIAILAMVLMLFLAPHADRVAHAIIAQPLTAGGLGLLTIIVAPIAIVLSAITVILIPVALIIIFALVVAGLFGWIAIGYEIGQRFTKAIYQDWHPAFSAGLGTFALTIVARALTGIPVLNCVGWLAPFLLTMAGLGAVLMTRFGTQMVTVPSDTTTVVPTDSAGQTPA
ncbi:MAG: polymer-forming cytoskeletal protein [Chloroflexota bacterium]